MIKTILLSALVSTIANPLLNKQNNQTTISIYDENCSRRYSLIIKEHSSELIENSTNKAIEKFDNDNNPYVRHINMDYLIYVDSNNYGHKHIGIDNNKIIDIDTHEEIIVGEQFIGSAYSKLTDISYDDIPNNAIFCNYSYYFKNLQFEGFGKNENNTCAAVAAQILFGYYDSTFNDDVVEEKYDNPVSEYKNICSQFSISPSTKGDEFLRYLINYINSNYDVNIEKYGLNTFTQIQFMNDYIRTIRNLKHSYNSSEGNVADILSGRQFIIVQNAIKKGRPVILNNLGHAMVAFAYDSTYVYLMSGWRNDKKMAKMRWDDYHGNIFNNYCSAYDLVLDGKEEHKCSNNYYSLSLKKFICPRGGSL